MAKAMDRAARRAAVAGLATDQWGNLKGHNWSAVATADGFSVKLVGTTPDQLRAIVAIVLAP